MKLLLYLFVFFGIFIPSNLSFVPVTDNLIPDRTVQKKEQTITPMEALDKVKKYYAANFDKIEMEDSEDEYYYKATNTDLYLAYEGEVGEEKNYLIHLYEFVIDELETGFGHTYTYGWFTVNRITGEIMEQVY